MLSNQHMCGFELQNLKGGEWSNKNWKSCDVSVNGDPESKQKKDQKCSSLMATETLVTKYFRQAAGSPFYNPIPSSPFYPTSSFYGFLWSIFFGDVIYFIPCVQKKVGFSGAPPLTTSRRRCNKSLERAFCTDSATASTLWLWLT